MPSRCRGALFLCNAVARAGAPWVRDRSDAFMILSLSVLSLIFLTFLGLAAALLKFDVLGSGLLLAVFAVIGLFLIAREWSQLVKTLRRRRRARERGQRMLARLVAIEPRWGRPPACRWVLEVAYRGSLIRLEDDFMFAAPGLGPGQQVEIALIDDGSCDFAVVPSVKQ